MFCSHMVPHEIREHVYHNSRHSMQDAADALQWHIYNGLCENLKQDIKIINVLPVSSFPQYYKQPFVRASEFSTEYNSGNFNVGFCNVKWLRSYFKRASIHRALKRFLDSSDTPKTLFLYTASEAFLQALEKLKKKYDLKICVIIADLPDMSNLSSKKSFALKWAEKTYSKKAYARLSLIDHYVLLTKHMADYLKLDKPYCVMEGIATAQQEFSRPVYDCEIKTVFYGGTLHRRFGVLNLLKAFELIDGPDYRLVICGVGDCEEEIRAAAVADSRIRFCGKLPRAEVLKLQSEATVLVNPRQNNEAFAKYSFPSKNLEYLSSGIPFIAYKLDGIPDEYDDYILYVEDDSVSSLAHKITEICEKPGEERQRIGEKARTFVEEQKNQVVQTKKILSFLETCMQMEEICDP